MWKNVNAWIIAATMGGLLVLLINISPVARFGLAVELPSAWQQAPVGAYQDLSCDSRHAEGMPFAFKRPNATQSCTFDTNRFALALNGAVGLVLGLVVASVGLKRYSNNKVNNKTGERTHAK